VDIYWVQIQRSYAKLVKRIFRFFSATDSPRLVASEVELPVAHDSLADEEGLHLLSYQNHRPDARKQAPYPLECKSLTVKYPGATYPSIQNLNFRLPTNGRVALLGINGGGKSTLFETIALPDQPPDEGEILVFGKEVIENYWDISSESLIGYCAQFDGLIDFLTVRETFELIAELKLPAGLFESNSFLPRRYYDFPVRALSGGTRKKVLILAMNAGKPPLLLLDECTTGVDPIAGTSIISFLKNSVHKSSASEEAQNQAILFSSHRIDEAMTLCNQVILLNRGQVFLESSTDILEQLSKRFVQVDVIPLQPLSSEPVSQYASYQYSSPSCEQMAAASPAHQFLNLLSNHLGSSYAIKRYVIYGPYFIRLTLKKEVIKLSSIWKLLLDWEASGQIERFYFRKMEMEEVLALVYDEIHSYGP
jgi:ABC-type multidrug transport system ATPase subunit